MLRVLKGRDADGKEVSELRRDWKHQSESGKMMMENVCGDLASTAFYICFSLHESTPLNFSPSPADPYIP